MIEKMKPIIALGMRPDELCKQYSYKFEKNKHIFVPESVNK